MYLDKKTELSGRYSVEELVLETRECIVYHVYDKIAEEYMFTVEYFPDKILRRDENQHVVIHKSQVKYFEENVNSFEHNAHVIQGRIDSKAFGIIDVFCEKGTSYFVFREDSHMETFVEHFATKGDSIGKFLEFIATPKAKVVENSEEDVFSAMNQKSAEKNMRIYLSKLTDYHDGDLEMDEEAEISADAMLQVLYDNAEGRINPETWQGLPIEKATGEGIKPKPPIEIGDEELAWDEIYTRKPAELEKMEMTHPMKANIGFGAQSFVILLALALGVSLVVGVISYIVLFLIS